MRTRSAMPLALSLGLLTLIAPDATAQGQGNKPPSGFVALFNGSNLDGWRGMTTFDSRELAKMSEEKRADQLSKWTEDAKKHWSVKDGELINDGHGAYLTTEKDFGDIELLIEYKTIPRTDSGIYLRGTPQVQIWDSTREGGNFPNGGDKGSGGLWNNSKGAPGKDPLVLADRPFGEWNSFRIIQLGARTTVYLNDKLVVDNAIMENFFDRKSPLFAKGPIQLQTHGGEIRWRNIFVREIPPAEANKMLAAHDAEGFQAIFDGKSTKGWKGPMDNYEIVDGSLRCKPGKGGTIYHEKELADFVVRLEYKLPPGGNNGLAIRYPGTGDPAYAGMCEIQVLDDTSPKYGKLDPRQANGSSYGMVPAKPGYLRPVGEWNFEEVTVKGPKIKVELNGSVILDADLSTVHDYMANSAHPGKDRTSGFFGFAGHNDPVEFRNVAVKPLP
jgi:hypothetical protein